MMDVVAAEVGLLSHSRALAQATQTMENIRDFWPRDSRGWFTHYTSQASPTWTVEGEYSTIDSAIMIAGAIMAGNYFPELKSLADTLGIGLYT